MLLEEWTGMVPREWEALCSIVDTLAEKGTGSEVGWGCCAIC